MPETLDGTIRKIRYTGRSFDGNTFVIASIDGGQTVKGELHQPREGETYRFFGEYVPARPPFRGHDFAFTTSEVVVDMSADGVTQYLRNYIDGLGTIKAACLVEHFGPETLSVLRTEPERAAEVRGINPAIVRAIGEHFARVEEGDPATEAKLLEMFREARFPRRVIRQLMKAYRSSAPDRVAKNPYILMQYRGVGWKTVDSFATTRAKYDRAGMDRHKAAIREAFEELAADGHTCGTIRQVGDMAGKLLGMPLDGGAWAALAGAREVVAHERAAGEPEQYVALARYAHAEAEVAARLVGLMGGGLPFPEGFAVDGLADEQRQAVGVIADDRHGVAILTGAPGTGKSWTIVQTIKQLIACGVPADSILFCAPTGKAGRRGAELLAEAGVCGVVCSTIHKALCPAIAANDPAAHKDDAKTNRGREEFGFQKNENSPLEYQYIITDECFPRGTLVDTPLGQVDISEVRVGDQILNAYGVDHVVATSSKEVHRVVSLHSGSEAIHASERHPFFTQRGLVVACELRPGDFVLKTASAVRLLRGDADNRSMRATTLLRSALQQAMVGQLPGIQQTIHRGTQPQMRGGQTEILRVRQSGSRGTAQADRGSLPDQGTGSQAKDFREVKGDQAQTIGSRWQWSRSYPDRGGNGRFVAGIHLELHSGNQNGAGFRLSEPLQTGLGRPSIDDLHRVGRLFACRLESPGAGSPEDRIPDFARVDRVEVLESGDPRLDRFRDASGKLYFYDLQASRHQSFSVYGLLVHNCSMVDALLARSLLRAIPTGTRLLLVGDENQLPSVGPGSFLRDAMAAGVPSFTLREIRRSDAAGTVVKACHAIRDGRMPEPADTLDLADHKNWVHVEVDDPKRIADTIVELVSKVSTLDRVWDVQVVTPQKTRHPFATGPLNARLARLLNPVAREAIDAAIEAADGDEGDEECAMRRAYYIGDKVIRTENGIAKEMVGREAWEAEHAGAGGGMGGGDDPGDGDADADTDEFANDFEIPGEFAPHAFRPQWTFRGVDYALRPIPIVNGDVGQVIDIVDVRGTGRCVVVGLKNPDRLVRLPIGEAKLQQAYALTCHKLQGSQAPMIIIPVHHAVYHGLFTREWFYTALSRASMLCVTVGPLGSIEGAVGRKTVGRRRTRLRELLGKELAGRPRELVTVGN